MYGRGDQQVKVSYVNRFGRKRQYMATFEGAVPFLSRRHENADIRLGPGVLPGIHAGGSVRRLWWLAPQPDLAGGDGQRSQYSRGVGALARKGRDAFLTGLELADRDRTISVAVLKEILARLPFLLDVGLDYLTLARAPPAGWRRGATHPPRHSDRFGTRRRALHPRRTVDRAPPARQSASDRDPRSPARSWAIR